MAGLEKVLEEALALPVSERDELVARLLRSLEPEDGTELDPAAWEAAWTLELDRRMGEIRDGTAELVDGDQVLAEARAWLDARRP